MYYKHLVNLIIQLKRLTFSSYIHCYCGKCSKCPLHSSDNQICLDRCDWLKVCLKEQLWLVDLQYGIVGILLKFHMWTGVKNCRPASGVIFFIQEIGVYSLLGMFNLVPHMKFLICIHFKHVSGVNQLWNRPDLMRIFCTGTLPFPWNTVLLYSSRPTTKI